MRKKSIDALIIEPDLANGNLITGFAAATRQSETSKGPLNVSVVSNYADFDAAVDAVGDTVFVLDRKFPATSEEDSPDVQAEQAIQRLRDTFGRYTRVVLYTASEDDRNLAEDQIVHYVDKRTLDRGVGELFEKIRSLS